MSTIWIEDHFYVYLGPFKSGRSVYSKLLAFCPPEVVLGDLNESDDLDSKVDIWGLGVAYCCLRFGVKFCSELAKIETGDDYIYFLQSLVGLSGSERLSYCSSQSLSRILRVLTSVPKSSPSFDTLYISKCSEIMKTTPKAFSIISLEPSQRPKTRDILLLDLFREPISFSSSSFSSNNHPSRNTPPPVRTYSSLNYEGSKMSHLGGANSYLKVSVPRPDKNRYEERKEMRDKNQEEVKLRGGETENTRTRSREASREGWFSQSMREERMKTDPGGETKQLRKEEEREVEREIVSRERVVSRSREGSMKLGVRERIARPFYNSRNQYLFDSDSKNEPTNIEDVKLEASRAHESRALPPRPIAPLERASETRQGSVLAGTKRSVGERERRPDSLQRSIEMTPNLNQLDRSVENTSAIGDFKGEGPWKLDLSIKLIQSIFIVSFQEHFQSFSGALTFKRFSEEETPFSKSEFCQLDYKDQREINSTLSACTSIEKIEEVDRMRAEITVYGHKTTSNLKRYVSSGSIEIRPIILAAILNKNKKTLSETKWISMRSSNRDNNMIIEAEITVESDVEGERQKIRFDSLEQRRTREKPTKAEDFSPFQKESIGESQGRISPHNIYSREGTYEKELNRSNGKWSVSQIEKGKNETNRSIRKYNFEENERHETIEPEVRTKNNNEENQGQPRVIKSTFSFGNITEKGTREEQERLKSEIRRLQDELDDKRTRCAADPELSSKFETAIHDLRSIFTEF